jgi:alkanesulfonate monooxygenase SsuD/methylene tetrahydromethanopterin reductase-like flavin-dependent oxidoreductase (luciferase family)
MRDKGRQALRFAVHVHAEGSWADVRGIVELARVAEEGGWDGFFLNDHLGAGGSGGALPVADCGVVMAAVAAATRRVRIGPMVAALPRYRPWRLALQAATLDRLSGGRLVIGGRLPGDDRRAAETLAPYVEAGLTWWVEGVLDAFGTPDELHERVRRGPPRGDA